MFAPPVAKVQGKAPAGSTNSLALAARRPGHSQVDPALMLQRTVGNQAILRLMAAQRATKLVGNEPVGHNDQTADPPGPASREATPGISWDFSAIPIFPPDRGPTEPAVPRRAPPLPGVLQTKLAVGHVTDPLEHEADRAADQVMRMSAPEVVATATPLQISRKRAGYEEEKEQLQRKETGAVETSLNEAPASVHDVLRSPGQPLDQASRAYFEPRFGHDFSQVRVHSGTRAAESATAVGALAYTVGRNLVFSAGAYAPRTDSGRRLLAHELTHAVQQAEGRAGRPTLQRQPANNPRVDDPWTNLKRQLLGGNYVPPATSGPTSKLPEPDSRGPGYTEAARPASYRIRVIAHASPRWKGAPDAKEADRLNLELSQRRARAVGQAVEKRLTKLLPTGSTTTVEASADLNEGTVGVEEEAHGSRDTIKEARGNRKDNAKERRRVNVYVSSSQDVLGEAPASKEAEFQPTSSIFWHIAVNVSGGAGEGVGAGFLAVALTNDKTGETMTGHVVGVTEGFSGPFPASASASFSDATGFSTKKPMNFEDFQNTLVLYT